MKPTILVVEDDVSILENLLEFLEFEGFLPRSALNGKIALDLLRVMDPLPSAILLDLAMPVMDGLQFRIEQEKDPRIATIPIVLMSADHQIESKRVRMGAVEYLKKPLDIDVLSEVLKRLV